MHQFVIRRELGLGEVTHHTTIDWAQFCRDICEQYLIDHPAVNGRPKIVEIDESKFFQAKYNRGRGIWEHGHWVFGGIERGSGKCFLVEVPDRTAAILLPIIQQ